MWIEEEAWIEEEKGIMDIDRWFPLLEILIRFRMNLLESSESRGWTMDWYPGMYFSFASYSFYKPKVA